MKKSKLHFHNIRFTWFLSYMCILIIPILTMGISFYFTNRTISEEVAESKHVLIRHAVENIENTVRQMDSVWMNLMLDNSLQTLLSDRSDNSIEEFLYQVPAFQKTLEKYYPSVQGASILLYVEEWDYMITSSTANYSAYLHNALDFYGQMDISAEEWTDLLSQERHRKSYFISADYSYENYGTQSVVVAYPIPSSTIRSNLTAYIYISLPLSHLSNQITANEYEMLVLLSQDWKLLYSYSADGIGDSTGDINIDHPGYIFSYESMLDDNFYLGVMTPQNLFWYKRDFLTYVMLTCILAAGLMGILTITILTKRNYKPLSRILEYVKAGNSGNEYDAIIGSLQQLSTENYNYKHQLLTQKEHMASNYLLSRLHGRYSKLTDNDMIEYLDIPASDYAYMLVAFYRHEEGWEKLNSSSSPVRSMNKEQLPSFIIDNVFMEILNTPIISYKMNDDYLLTYLFCLPFTDSGIVRDKILRSLDKTCRVFHEELKLPLGVIADEPCEDFACLPNQYRKILSCYECQFVSESYKVIHVSDLTDTFTENEELFILEDLGRQLHNAISVQDTDASLNLTQNLFQTLYQQMNIPFEFARYYILHLAYRIAFLSSFKEGNPHKTVNFLEVFNDSKDSIHLMEIFTSFIRELCAVDDVNRNETPSVIAGEVGNYIKEHYTDPNLSLSLIGDAMNLSPKYISRIFRAQNTIGILDYINLKRIRKAKELLRDTPMTIDDVALSVGYTNSKTFRRAFQKIEGTNPSAIRALDIR